MPPQLFDLVEDPNETRDLAGDPAHAATLADCERELRAICDPEEVDRRARADQRRKIEEAGGMQAVLSGHVKVQYTPVPAEFEPAIEAATERAI
jgi:choline-sulfatase